MNVILIAPTLSYRGAERLALNLAQGLDEQKHQVRLLFLRRDTHYNITHIPEHVTCTTPPTLLNAYLQNNLFFLLCSFPLCLYYLFKYARKATIIQSESFPCLLPAALYTALWRKKLIWIIHDYDPSSLKSNISSLIMHYCNCLALPMVTAALTVSPKAAQETKKFFPHLKITTLLPPLNSERLASPKPQALKTHLQLSDSFLILLVGAYHQLKNQRLAIDTLSLVLPHIPSCKLILAGGGDPTPLIHYAAEKNLSPHCLIQGFVPDDEIKNYFALANLTLVTSHAKQEGLNITLFEAMYLKCLTLCVEGPGAASIIKENALGIVTPATATEIASAITNVYKSPQNYQHAREHAYNFVTEKMSITAYTQAVVTMYRSVLTN